MLYEPTNISPSTFTQTGTVAQADNINIQWQVNGTSQLTKFQIDMYDNASSNLIHSTGVVSEYGSALQNTLPFYGKDRYGKYVPFVYSLTDDWQSWGINDGGDYYFYITQFFPENNVIASYQLQSNLTGGVSYYFSYTVNGRTYYAQFLCVDAALFLAGTTIYFNHTASTGWICFGTNNRIVYNLTFSETSVIPEGSTSLGAATILSAQSTGRDALFYNTSFTQQNAPAFFLSLTAPQLTINPVNSPISSAVQTFSAVYNQPQNKSISSVRWVLVNSTTNSVADDTGIIHTPVLEYVYGGLFGSNNYSLSCTVETQNGVSVSDSIQFEVEFSEQSYLGDLVVECVRYDDSILLSWDGVSVIEGVATPEDGYAINNGTLTLNNNNTITWSTQVTPATDEEGLNIATPWSLAWSGEIHQPISTQFSQDIVSNIRATGTYGNIYTLSFNPNGNLFVAGGDLEDAGLSVFSLGGNTITWLYNLNEVSGHPVNCATFNPAGNLLVVGGNFGAYLYSVSGSTINYIGPITINGNRLLGVSACTFSPDGNFLILCSSVVGQVSGQNDHGVMLFSINGSVVTWINDVAPQSGGLFDGRVYCASFNPAGNLLVVGGSFTGGAYLYSVNGANITWLATLTTVTNTAINGNVYCCAFSPNGNSLVIGGDFPRYGIQYTLSGSTIISRTYFFKNGTTQLDGAIRGVTFNQTQSDLVICGEFSGKASVYFSNGSSLLWFRDLEFDVGGAITNNVYAAQFSTDSSFLVLGGQNISDCFYITSITEFEYFGIVGYPNGGNIGDIAFGSTSDLLVGTNAASVFRINGERLSFLGSLFSEDMSSAAFSPRGDLLVLSDYTRIYLYSINQDVIAYISDTQLTPASLQQIPIAFKPDGALLIARSSIFSVSGTSITLVGSLGDTAGTAINYSARTLAFNPMGTLLVVGGATYFFWVFSVSGNSVTWLYNVDINSTQSCSVFSPNGDVLFVGSGNEAKIYSVNGAQITWLYDLPNISSQVYCAAFNPAGNLLVVGGNFGAYLYSVSGSQLTFIGIISHNGASISSVISCTFNQDGGLLAISTSEDSYLYVVSEISETENELFNINSNIFVKIEDNIIKFVSNSSEIASVPLLSSTNGVANKINIALTPNQLIVYSFYNNAYIGNSADNYSFTQHNLQSLQLTGYQVCDYVFVCAGTGENFLSNLSEPDFVPAWNNNNYTPLLLANFIHGIDGGTGTSTGQGFRLYRQADNEGAPRSIAELPSTTLQVKDYSIKSGIGYTYYFYVYDANDAFMGVITTEVPARKFSKFSLLSTRFNETDGCYHVVKEYQFSCNIQDMAISNNSNKTYAQNFTPYPTVFNSSANYASGTLQALIGFVDKQAYRYWDSVALMDELNALSTTNDTLFLRDMKGHLWMVDVGTVTQTATQKTREMQVTISLPWTEIGDASEVSIIQTPEDEGWNYDAQVLDVRLAVDVLTGELSVVYPFPYRGTTFRYSNATLNATTPSGITSAVLPLPATAQEPEDGQLEAEIRQNMEEDN